MRPIKFKEQNMTFCKPQNMTDKECMPLPAFRDDRQVISCWKMTFVERVKVLFTGVIWFSLLGWSQPPIWLDVGYPFIKQRKKSKKHGK